MTSGLFVFCTVPVTSADGSTGDGSAVSIVIAVSVTVVVLVALFLLFFTVHSRRTRKILLYTRIKYHI